MEKNKPLISFILTCYNLPVQLLCECIDSILALSLNPEEREIIVVDDGSEVSPMNGLMHYGNEIIYVRQSNKGVSVARNVALHMAQGIYVQMVDGDDMLLKAPYDFCIDIIRKNPDTEVLIFDFTHEKNEAASTFKEPAMTSGAEYMRSHNIRGAIWSYLFRQSVRSKLEFTPGIVYAEDEEFTPQLLLRAEVIRYTDAKAYFYRKRKTSAVHQHDESSIGKRLDNTRDVILHLQELAATLPNNDRLAMQRRVAQLTMDYLYNTILLSRSREELEKRIDECRQEGLFPLPEQDYSTKYTWFRRMSNTSLGRAVLLRTLPLLKKER